MPSCVDVQIRTVMATGLPAAKHQAAERQGSKVLPYLAALLVLVAARFDLLLQAPLAGLAVSMLALLWAVVTLVVGVVKQQSTLATLARHKAAVLLVGTYFASVGCGELISHLVLNEAQALRIHLLQSGKAEKAVASNQAQQAAYASFCASRFNGRCGWLNYHIYFYPESMPSGATQPGTLVAHQFFTERVSIALVTGEVLERRSVD